MYPVFPHKTNAIVTFSLLYHSLGLNQPAITPVVHHHHHHSEGKRRRNTSRSVEQCEREIQRLQASVDSLRKKLSLENITESVNDKDDESKYSDGKIRSIIAR